jgi:sporulation protein YlmC with PRC-barrel domain
MQKLIIAAALALLASSAAYSETATPGTARLMTSLPAGSGTVTNYYKQNVYDPSDNKIGEIVDVLVDQEGRVNALIIGVGGFLGAGEKDIAVPFNAVHGKKKDNKWVVGHEYDQGRPEKRARLQIRQQQDPVGSRQVVDEEPEKTPRAHARGVSYCRHRDADNST